MANVPLAMDHFENPDPVLTGKIVTHLKSQGIFDQFRRECMADVDTKPAYQNLRQRVEGSVAAFLRKNPWKPDMNKNQMRDNLRKHIQSGGFLDIGVDRIVDQVVNPKIYTVFLPKVEEVVNNCLGMENDKLTFKPSPCREVKPELTQFQNKHNLAPRARMASTLAGPRLPLIPNIQSLKPPEPLQTKKLPGEDSGSPGQEEMANDSFLLNEEDNEDTADDDEESPAFEPHSQTDRLILGVRTDTSDSNSEDSQVVTTIVDDNLEERIDNDDTVVKEESDDKEDKNEDDSSSDEYVPKTPTINMEGSDGSMIEFNSISEYRQYQTKFDEVNFGNVEEEIVSSHWVDENSQYVKEERSSNEEDSGESSRKRKLNIEDEDDDDDDSWSEDKGDNSNKIVPAVFEHCVMKIRKLDEFEDEESESASEYVVNDIDDSNPERPIDMFDLKLKMSENELREKSKASGSSSSKESGKSHHSYQDQRDSPSCERNSSKENVMDKETGEYSVSTSYSSKDKKENHKKDEISRDHNKDRERKKSDSSSSKHSDRDNRHKHNNKDKERHREKKRTDKSEVDKKEKDDSGRVKKESRHEHKDRSKDHHHKDKKHDNHDKNSDEKKIYDSSHRHDKDKKDGSKSSRHSHSSSKHRHKSSSESNKSDQKHRESSDKHKSHSKNSDKDSKDESRKKPRKHCKSRDKDTDGRRSTDRDSNGPSSRSHLSSTSTVSSKSSSSRNQTERSETGDRTTSNSDNAVSDNIESIIDGVEEGIASPDPEPIIGSWSDTNSELNESRDSIENESFETDDDSRLSRSANIKELDKISSHENVVECKETEKLNNTKDHIFVGEGSEQGDTMPPSSVHITTSEKENIEQALNNNELSLPDETLSTKGDKVGKFKKPKIAANIFEVKKIMQARRHLKRMEEKRMKLLVKDSVGECPVENNSQSTNNVDQKQDEDFRGFEEVLSNKIEMYNSLINRLSSEITTTSCDEVKASNLITSWIDVDPSLDEYIETVLKGKVHRKTRVRLPPICEDYYRFDAEQNVYILLERNNESPKLDECEVDNNLNNLNPILKNKEMFNNALHDDCQNTFNGKSSKSKDNLSQASKFPEIDKKSTPLQEKKDEVNRKSPKRKTPNKQPQISKDVLENNANTGDIAEKISQKLINDVIGIQDGTVVIGDSEDEDATSGDDTAKRDSSAKQQQSDKNVDLYKPRPQITTRRGRRQPPSEADSPTPTATGRKRLAAPEVNATTLKRRR